MSDAPSATAVTSFGYPTRKAATAAISAHLEVIRGKPMRASLARALAEGGNLGGKERRFIAFAVRELSRHQRWLDFVSKETGHPPSSLKLDEDRALFRYAIWRRFKMEGSIEQVMREVALPGPLRPRSIPDTLISTAISGQPKLPSEQDEPGLRFSFPAWLAEAIGDPAILQALNREPALTFKVRPHGTRDEVQAQLLAKGITTRPVAENGLILESEGRAIFESAPMKNGRLIVMDVGSQKIVELCGLKGGESVVDYCAGAGGKTIALADSVGDRGRIFAWDKFPQRLSEAKSRVKELAIRHVSFPREPRFDGVDLVLIDAPCSGTGTLAREPDRKWKLKAKEVEEFAQTQTEVLDLVAEKAPKSILVYATCSVLRAENEDVVQGFLKRHPTYTLQQELRVLPQHSEGGGFYAARLLPSLTQEH